MSIFKNRNAKVMPWSKEEELYIVSGVDFHTRLKRIGSNTVFNLYRIPGHTVHVDRMTGSVYQPTQYLLENLVTGDLELLDSIKVAKEEK